MASTNEPFEFDLGDDLKITKTTRRASGGGTWVCGTIAGHRFDALVFPEHAENEEYEIGRSRISKLWIATIDKKRTVYNWDRGLDFDATTPEVRGVVEFLCEGLATLVYGE